MHCLRMIGVFDSGYGGLSVLKALREELPQYDYIYLGDNARAPYGARSLEEIHRFTLEGVEELFARGCPLVILGCNTASAAALRRIQQEVLPDKYPDRRVLGIVVPTIEQITGADWRHTEAITTPVFEGAVTIGVLGTQATIQSSVYESEVHKRNPSLRVVQQVCPNLADLVEGDAPHEEVANEIQACTTQLVEAADDSLQAVLLGCTHYELVADQIAEVLPARVELYHQPTIVARSLVEYLQRHPEMKKRLSKESGLSLFTTGNISTVTKQAEKYYMGIEATFREV